MSNELVQEHIFLISEYFIYVYVKKTTELVVFFTISFHFYFSLEKKVMNLQEKDDNCTFSIQKLYFHMKEKQMSFV